MRSRVTVRSALHFRVNVELRRSKLCSQRNTGQHHSSDKAVPALEATMETEHEEFERPTCFTQGMVLPPGSETQTDAEARHGLDINSRSHSDITLQSKVPVR